MMILILGENGSGKSAFAEKLATSICNGKLYYIATMLPYGTEGAHRIAKHRAQREGMGFLTLESPYGVAELAEPDTALLEDVSNLLANLLFEQNAPDAGKAALARILALHGTCQNLIAVSIAGIDMEDSNDEKTRAYISSLNQLNAKLSVHVDVVIEMQSGLPVLRKGQAPC